MDREAWQGTVWDKKRVGHDLATKQQQQKFKLKYLKLKFPLITQVACERADAH